MCWGDVGVVCVSAWFDWGSLSAARVCYRVGRGMVLLIKHVAGVERGVKTCV